MAGSVYDGEDPNFIDIDYTDEATTVTAHFAGFLSSRCGGLSYFEWAVGSSWEEEEERETVMEFTSHGLVVVDSTTGSGYAQV